MSRTSGKSVLKQVSSKLDGHSPHGEMTGVKSFEAKPKMIGTGLNTLVSEQTNESTVAHGNETPSMSSAQTSPSPKPEESAHEVVVTNHQEVIIHKRRTNRSIFKPDEEKVNDTKGMSFQVDLELIPIIKKYTKWGKGYKTINLMLISTLLDNEDVVEDLLKHDITTYNTLIRLEEKYQKKLEEY